MFGNQTRSWQENHSQRHKVTKHFPHKLKSGKAWRFWYCQTSFVNKIEKQNCCWYTLLHVSINMRKQRIFTKNWHLVARSYTFWNVLIKAAFWCKFFACSCIKNIQRWIWGCSFPLQQITKKTYHITFTSWFCKKACHSLSLEMSIIEITYWHIFISGNQITRVFPYDSSFTKLFSKRWCECKERYFQIG